MFSSARLPLHPKTGTNRWIVVVFLLLAYGLYVIGLDQFSFWIDESLTPLRAGYDLPAILQNVIIIQGATTFDTHPAFYYLSLHFGMSLWGRSDFALRYFSVVCALLTLPFLYVWAKELFNRRTAVLALGLGAVNPLLAWYAQEARMYTLLVLLSTASSYFLWRTVLEITKPQPQKSRLRRFGLYYLMAAFLLANTHYSAAFLLAGQAVFFAWALFKGGHRRLVIALLLTGGVIGITLFPFTVPRLFTGAETAYRFQPLTVILGDIVRGFTMGVTPIRVPLVTQALYWALLAALITVAALLGLRKPVWISGYLLMALLAAAVGIGLLSFIKPMYLGVRHIMIGLPAFVVIMAAGIDTLTRIPTGWGRPAGWIIAALLLTAAGTALYSRYTDPRWAKDNFRQAVAYVEKMAGQNDIVVYGDAIAMQTHFHYGRRQASDLPVTALPAYPKMAGPETEASLAELSSRYDRIWLLPGLPIDDRDPERVVRRWLADHAIKIMERPFFARGSELRVELYDTRPLLNPSSPPDIIVEQTAPHYPTLLGVTLREQTGRQIWVDLDWQGLEDRSSAQIHLGLVGPDDWEWAAFDGPLWQGAPLDIRPEIRIRTPIALQLPTGLPGGTYRLMAQAIREGDAVWGPLELAQIEFPGARPVDLPPTAVEFENGWRLTGVEPPLEVRAGGWFTLDSLWWGAQVPDPANLEVDLQIFDRQDQLIYETAAPLLQADASWRSGAPLRVRQAVLLPGRAEPGRYELRWRLRQQDQPIAGVAGLLNISRDWHPLGTVQVEVPPLLTRRSRDYAPPAFSIEASWGELATLIGYDLQHTAAALTVDLIWEAGRPFPKSYFSFVHLVDPAGDIVRQQDWIPAGGTRPTDGWRTDEIIIDSYRLSLADLPPGRYQLVTGLYDPDSFDRPVVTWQGQAQPDRQLVLQEIEIPVR